MYIHSLNSILQRQLTVKSNKHVILVGNKYYKKQWNLKMLPDSH